MNVSSWYMKPGLCHFEISSHVTQTLATVGDLQPSLNCEPEHQDSVDVMMNFHQRMHETG